MLELFDSSAKLIGPSGSILLPDDDEITRKLAMLFEGQCEGLGPTQAARKFGYTKQRYFQLLEHFEAQGALALQSKARGPKTNYRRTEEMVRQIIRHRFLDPDASAEVIAQKLQQAHHLISIRSVERVISDFGLQKKLYACRPRTIPQQIQTQRTQRKKRLEPCDPASLEREVRQLLADKISGNQVGIWLLLPEHLRLGTWDLLCAWSHCDGQTVWPRTALHLVHEAALCVSGLRKHRSLTQKGFELSNGLPFVPTDFAIHELLKCHTIAEAQALQVALGKIRRASGHFPGRLLAIDPHRIRSSTKRQMRQHRFNADQKALKMSQCFFCLDLESCQPLCFTLASAAKTVTQATPELLELSQQILNPASGHGPLVLADTEHYSTELIDQVHLETPFELLLPMPARSSPKLDSQPLDFNPRWAGYATAKEPFRLEHSCSAEPYFRFTQRNAERKEDYSYKSFLATTDRDEVEDLTVHYPQRWHVEEFFKFNQALGWHRAGTLNLNIRYGQMTMALLAQAAIHQMRQRLGQPFCQWDAAHLARDIFGALEGDVRVKDDTILVTYYNAPHQKRLREHYENLPAKLRQEGLEPTLPRLYGFQLDFRFR